MFLFVSQRLTLTLVVFEFDYYGIGSTALFCLTLTLVVFESFVPLPMEKDILGLTLTLVVFEWNVGQNTAIILLKV